MELTARRKDIIKNITIIFLIIMLVLTFFSSTIMNRSLPEVAAQYAYSGQITTSVRANGTTTANENYQVILEEGRIIHSVEVRRGDKVNAGDLLFTLEEGESTELREAEDQLTKAEQDYKKWQMTSNAEIADKEREIQYKTEDLAKIKARGINSTVDTSEQEKEIKELEKQLGIYKRADAALSLDLTKAALDAAELALEAAEDDYEQKSEAYNELKGTQTGSSPEQLESQLLSSDRDIEDREVNLARQQQKYEEQQSTHAELLENRKKLEQQVKSAESIYNSYAGDQFIIESQIASNQGTISRLTSLPSLTEEETLELAQARGNLSYYQALLSSTMSEQSEAQADLNRAKSEYSANESAISQAEAQLETMAQTIEDQTRTLERAKSDRAAIAARLEKLLSQPSQDELDAELDAAQALMRAAEDVREDAQEVYADAQSAYNAAKSAYESAKQNGRSTDTVYTREQLEKLIVSTELELEHAREALEDLKDSSNNYTDGYSNYTAYVEAITAQQRTIEGLKTDLARTREEHALEEPTYLDAIARAKESVERISETVGSNEIFAKVSGTINNIAVSAGQEIKSQTVLAEIEQADRGYSVELTMTTEQSKRIAVGQAATILYYWGTTPEATVESIKPSQSDPQNSRIVTLTLNGDITAGQNFTFSLGERSANYDNVVPSSAIREDSNGKFVLVVEAKNTPIGNRYTAVRRDVDVIAEDDTNTAVSGLTGGEFVITTSQTPISAGQQVRLSDN
ncbi:MAG: HlyD family efflux transporter periplasmic adaptor subunit [Clostridia bacterium]|nr:HlyD family efflux transporter periplasmic adaptor subunit [Clostridia bacterium]